MIVVTPDVESHFLFFLHCYIVTLKLNFPSWVIHSFTNPLAHSFIHLFTKYLQNTCSWEADLSGWSSSQPTLQVLGQPGLQGESLCQDR